MNYPVSFTDLDIQLIVNGKKNQFRIINPDRLREGFQSTQGMSKGEFRILPDSLPTGSSGKNCIVRCSRRGTYRYLGSSTYMKEFGVYKVGQLVPVKEYWATVPAHLSEDGCPYFTYRATDFGWTSMVGWRWNAPSRMPARAVRLHMRIVGAWLEKAGDATLGDAQAEGFYGTDPLSQIRILYGDEWTQVFQFSLENPGGT